METTPASQHTTPQTVTVQPWPDAVIDVIGHDPRSVYAETFWLPSLGPTAVLLLRRLDDRFEHSPDGFEVGGADLSRQLGLGEREGVSSPLVRTLRRLVQFGLACFVESETGDEIVQVRRMLPPIAQRHVRRLPAPLAAEHERFLAASLEQSPAERTRARARRLAFVMLETGDESSTIERSLLSIGFAPTVAVEALRWAVSRHLAAQAALSDEAA